MRCILHVGIRIIFDFLFIVIYSISWISPPNTPLSLVIFLVNTLNQTNFLVKSYMVINSNPSIQLFLKELVKFTEPTHPDYAKLEKAYEEVRQVNHKINESIREANNRLKLIEIQRSFIDTLWGASIPTVCKRFEQLTNVK
jgi:hypothetical protein